MDFTNCIDHIWSYSKFYGDMLSSSLYLNKIEENYCATLILFNAMELIIKSIRENDKHNLTNDIKWLRENEYISLDDEKFLDDKNFGIRNLRNLMTHRDLYEYCIEINNIAYPFATKETWKYIFEMIAPKILTIIENIVLKNNIK